MADEDASHIGGDDGIESDILADKENQVEDVVVNMDNFYNTMLIPWWCVIYPILNL